MAARRWSFWALQILSVIGLVLGPMGAATTNAAAIIPVQAGMSDDMSCCPEGKAAVPQCQKACLTLASCALKCFAGAGTLIGRVFVPRTDGVLPPKLISEVPATRAQEPPARPPRT